MSDHDGRNTEASVLAERKRAERKQTERESRERAKREILEMKHEIEVLRRKVKEQKLRAERDAMHAEVARGAKGGRSGETTARDSTSSPAVPISALAAQPGTSQISLSRPNWYQLTPPKFDNIEAHVGMWRSKFQAFMSSVGWLYVLKATDNPVMVGGVNVSQEELEQRHTPKEIIDARVVYGLLMDSTTGYAIAEFRMQQARPPSGAWQELEDYYMPSTLAATHRLKRRFEAIHMEEGEDPLVFLGRVDKAADELAMLGCGKCVEEVNRHIVTNLSSL